MLYPGRFILVESVGGKGCNVVKMLSLSKLVDEQGTACNFANVLDFKTAAESCIFLRTSLTFTFCIL